MGEGFSDSFRRFAEVDGNAVGEGVDKLAERAFRAFCGGGAADGRFCGCGAGLSLGQGGVQDFDRAVFQLAAAGDFFKHQSVPLHRMHDKRNSIYFASTAARGFLQ